MKAVFLSSIFVLTSSLYAGQLFVMRGEPSAAIGAEVSSYSLDSAKGSAELLLTDVQNQNCRISISMLKDLGIDPLQLALSMVNTRNGDGPILTCYTTKEQDGAEGRAYRISIYNYPKP